MNLSELSVRRPVFATVISLALVLLGLATLRTLPVREHPAVAPPFVTVATSYRGAAAEVVETQVTRRIEEQLAGIEGLVRTQSFSSEGGSRVVLEFALDRDLEDAANDVRNRVSRIASALPGAAGDPRVIKAGSGIPPALWITVRSDGHGILELTDIVQRQLVDPLATIDGVAGIGVAGAQEPGLRVWLDPRAMAARGVTAQEVARVLDQENAEFPAGRIESREREFALRTRADLATPADFEALVVRRNENGRPVRLGDVAEVAVAETGQRWSARVNGQPAITLGLEPTAAANPLAVSRAVRERLAAIAPTLPVGVVAEVGYDQAGFVQDAIRQVLAALAYALVLVVAVIYVFLGEFRATLVPAMTIPICLVASFAALAWFGYSVNILILLGLVLAIGLVVDDAIVVLENIYRHVEQGRPPLLAAADGAREITFAVIATTAVLVAVFLPLSFMEGRLGRLFREFGVAISAAVSISSLVALTLVPMLCSRLFAGGPRRRGLAGRERDAFARLADRYRQALAPIVARPTWALLAVAVLVGLAARLNGGLPAEHTPRVDRDVVRIFMHAPAGASFDYADRYASAMEDILLAEAAGGEIERVLVRVPGYGGNDAVNSARAVVRLVPRAKRSRDAAEIAAALEEKLDELPGARFYTVLPRGLGGGEDARPVRLVLGGESYEEVADWAEQLVAAADAHPAIANPDSSFEARRPQLSVEIDRARAADLGVSLAGIGETLETMLGSSVATRYTLRDRDYPVVLQGRTDDRGSREALALIHVRSETTGALIPLAHLVTLTETTAPGTYVRLDRMRTVTVSAGVAEGHSLAEALDALEGLARDLLPPRARIDYDGESRRFREAGGSMELLFLMSLLVVFLVLAAQFESFLNPLVIMTSVPLAVTGGLLGLALVDGSLNVYSRLGMVLLVGLAAKNGVLIVEFANQLRDRGYALKQAATEAAAIRLRPILMTSLCTAAGALPLLLGGGADAETRRPLGAVIVSGVLVSAVLTLFVVPALYALLAGPTRSPQHLGRLIRRLRRDAASGAQQAPEPGH